MKRVLIMVVFIIATVQVNAQDAITKFFNKYDSDEDFTHVNITSRMFGLFTEMEVENEEDQAVLDAISKLQGLKILAKNNTTQGKKLYTEAILLVPKKEYDELMTIKDKDHDMVFLIKEKSGKISELLMIMGGDTEFFVLSLYGEIDLKQMAKLSKAMDIDGLEQLQKLDKDN